jgi:hypothetical protein
LFLLFVLCIPLVHADDPVAGPDDITGPVQAKNVPEQETDARASAEVLPMYMIFHDIGWNFLHSVAYNYGANFIGAGLSTWGLIESGIDWQWNRLAYNNRALAYSGMPTVYMGYFVPGLAPLAFYIAGALIKDKRAQITGLALTQSLILGVSIKASMKMITGRAMPGIVTELDQVRYTRTDDFSKEFDWFNMKYVAGWPSGHVVNAFAAAATIAEIYDDYGWVKAAAYVYAALITVGCSVNVHWLSDNVAAALIGYAIGKTVGKNFSKLAYNNRIAREKDIRVSFNFGLNTVGLALQW